MTPPGKSALSLAVLAAVILVASVSPSSADTAYLRIEVLVPEGAESALYIQGNALVWSHRHGAFPTNFRINGVAWTPSWTDCVGEDPLTDWVDCHSSYFWGAIPLYAAAKEATQLDPGTGRFIPAETSCWLTGGGCVVGSGRLGDIHYADTPAYHLLFQGTGQVAIGVSYTYDPQPPPAGVVFDVVPNDTDNFVTCEAKTIQGGTVVRCTGLHLGISNVFALLEFTNEYPDGRILWPLDGAAPGLTLSVGVGVQTLTGAVEKAHLMDYDGDGKWDWVVPLRAPDGFSCPPGTTYDDVTVDLRFRSGRHYRGSDRLSCR